MGQDPDKLRQVTDAAQGMRGELLRRKVRRAVRRGLCPNSGEKEEVVKQSPLTKGVSTYYNLCWLQFPLRFSVPPPYI